TASQILVFGFLILLLVHCKSGSQEKMNEADVNERLTEINRVMVRNEARDIEDFIERHQLKMESTGTGLRVQITNRGTGKLPALHNEVVMVYSVYLLNGSMCYSATEKNPYRFHLGEGQQPRGLEDALQTIPEGSMAKIIVPSHLAFGNTGDGDKIPGASALYYEVHLLKVQP
ncbi:MAG TPA: FKBP-type peptidyl-prolyl cis-trans isomerase, partial [Bacteroidia bacterium]|nr:FKBP-type peptidyl-prolyl cis-trans isomerase [Bacteroidia bacterium]